MKFAWITEPPFNFRNADGVTGCDVALAKTAIAMLGESFEPVETEFAELLPGLADGRWDVTTGMFTTPERAALAAFTMPIWGLRDGLLIRKDDAVKIRGYRDVAKAGGKLAVLDGQVQHSTAIRLGVPASAIIVLRGYAEAAQAVTDGIVLAYASVELAHRAHIARHSRTGLATVAVPEVEKPAEPGAFACRNTAIRDRLDSVLHGLIGSADHAKMLRSFGLDPDTLKV